MNVVGTSGGQDWDPAQYSRFALERAQPFWDLVALVEPPPAGRFQRAADLGCGTGELTAELGRRLGIGDVLGVDSSPSMLAQAQAHVADGLRFEHGDIGSWSPAGGDHAESWLVRTGSERHGPFDAVVNALWQGRPSIDRSAGHRPDVAEQHRYRVSLFVRTARRVDSPSAVLAFGPFGDVKRYGGRDFYLSWYPAGLLARGESVDPPPAPMLVDDERERIATTVWAELEAALPWVGEIKRAAMQVRVEGGWVYSQGRGALDDPGAGVHRRDRLGISRLGSYFSVDTGKYSVAPALAQRLARAIVR